MANEGEYERYKLVVFSNGEVLRIDGYSGETLILDLKRTIGSKDFVSAKWHEVEQPDYPESK